MKKSVSVGSRFEDDAGKYAAYLESNEGRLRVDLTFANLVEFLPGPPDTKTLRALDLGGGTGEAAIRLARLGIHVTLLDCSAAMLALAERSIANSGFSDRVAIRLGDACGAPDIFRPGSFDLVACHNLLEYVHNPSAVLSEAARLLRNSSSILSVLVRSQAGEVLKAALQTGDLALAEENLCAGWAQESLYGGSVRLFTSEALEALLRDARLTVKARRGVRVLSDYLPEKLSRSAQYERILSLERKLGERREFFGVARYMHFLAGPEAHRSEAVE